MPPNFGELQQALANRNALAIRHAMDNLLTGRQDPQFVRGIGNQLCRAYPWGGILDLVLQAVVEAREGASSNAFETTLKACKILEESLDNVSVQDAFLGEGLIPVLVLHLVLFAGTSKGQLEKAAVFLRKLLPNRVLFDAFPRATMSVMTAVFRARFSLRAVRDCEALLQLPGIAGWEGGSCPQFPAEDVLSFKYYLGRLRMFDMNFPAAEKLLHESLLLSSAAQLDTRRRILLPLITLRLRLGVAPTRQTLQFYNLNFMVPIVQAVRDGDVAGFLKAVETHIATLVCCGLYPIILEARNAALRNLAAKIVFIAGHAGETPGRVSLHGFVAVAKALKQDIDLDQAEFYFGALIRSRLCQSIADLSGSVDGVRND